MQTTKLSPVFVTANVTAAGNALFDGVRRRPAACFTQDGRAVVCSPRTARKHGWTIVARTFIRA